jgi:hypothetical protein
MSVAVGLVPIEEDTMNRSPLALLAASLLGAAVLAGCGGGSKSTSQSTSAPRATTTTATTGATGTSSSSGVLTYQQAVETCQHEIHAVAALLPEGPSSLEGTCGRAVKSGTTAEVKKATRELCEGAMEQTSGLASSIKNRTLAECRNRTK